MRKMLLIPLILCMVALLPTLWMPTVHATPPKEGSGTFDSSIEDTVDYYFPGGNVIMHSYGGGGELFGILEGRWIHDEWAVIHPSGIMTLTGVWDTPDGVTLNDDGESYFGNIHVRYWGTVDMATEVFEGQWVILSGTGELANLRGHGTVGSDPAIGAYSTFVYHFDP